MTRRPDGPAVVRPDQTRSGQRVFPREVARSLLDRVGHDDQVGLWTFAGTPTASRIKQQRPLQPARREHVAAITADLRAITPESGSAPLYEVIAKGIQAVRANWTPRAVNALVIGTDAQHQVNSDPSREALAEIAAGASDRPVRLLVVVFRPGRCDQLTDVFVRYGLDGVCYGAAALSSLRRVYASIANELRTVSP